MAPADKTPPRRTPPRSSFSLSNVTIDGFAVGVRAGPDVHLDASNVTFRNVDKAWQIEGTAKVQGARVSGSKSKGQRSSVGWSKSSGPPLPVFCTECKSIFPSAHYDFSGQYFESWDNEETCPECGNPHAKLSEGIFNLARETIEVLSAPDITHAMIVALREVSAGVLSGRIDEASAVQSATAVDPRMGDLLRKWLGYGRSALFWAVTLYTLYLTQQSTELQKASRTDHLLEAILTEMRASRFTLEGPKRENGQPEVHRDQASDPAQNKSPSKPGAKKFSTQKKPKGRDLRRHAARDRREAFGRARGR